MTSSTALSHTRLRSWSLLARSTRWVGADLLTSRARQVAIAVPSQGHRCSSRPKGPRFQSCHRDTHDRRRRHRRRPLGPGDRGKSVRRQRFHRERDAPNPSAGEAAREQTKGARRYVGTVGRTPAREVIEAQAKKATSHGAAKIRVTKPAACANRGGDAWVRRPGDAASPPDADRRSSAGFRPDGRN